MGIGRMCNAPVTTWFVKPENGIIFSTCDKHGVEESGAKFLQIIKISFQDAMVWELMTT